MKLSLAIAWFTALLGSFIALMVIYGVNFVVNMPTEVKVTILAMAAVSVVCYATAWAYKTIVGADNE